jgi:hypothetical protein
MRQRTVMGASARRNSCRLVYSFVLLILSAGVAMAQSLENLYSVLPAEVSGWKKAEPPETYDKNNLYDYINGGAELPVMPSFYESLSKGA